MTFEKRRAALKSLFAGALSPWMPGCSAPPRRPADIAHGDFGKVVAYLQAMFTHEMHAQNLTGLSVAVVDGQRMTWTQGFGWADQAAGIPAGSDTVYRAGSISKLFTVAAALQFAERGLLELDEPIRHVLPEFRIGSRFGENAITPRQLMTHHAGLPRDLLRGMWCQAPESGFNAVLDHLAGSEPAYPPGEVWSYSNLGPSVLGAAVEHLAGTPFADHLQRALLQPLGMKTASFTGPLPASPNLSKAYAHGEESAEPGLRDIAAGGLNASVRDLGRWLMMIFAQGRSSGHTVLREATVADMLRVQNEAVALDFDLKMGLGWMLTRPTVQALADAGADLGPVASHGGATINHRSIIVALPQHRLGVAILCNSANARTLAQLADTTLAMMLEAKTGRRQLDATMAPPWRKADLPKSALADYVGEYVTPAGAVSVSTDGQRLRAKTPGLRVTLVPDSEGALHVRKELFGLFTLPLGDLEQLSLRRQMIAGRQVLTLQRNGAQMLFGERLNLLRHPPIHPGWRDMPGTYLPETNAGEFPLIERLTLFEANGMLNLRATLSKILADEPSGSLLVQTLSDALGIVVDKLDGRGETLAVHIRDGKKTLAFAGYTFQKLAV